MATPDVEKSIGDLIDRDVAITPIISEVFDTFQSGKVRDKSIDQYEFKPFNPVGGEDITNYKNNTLRIVTKGKNQHLHLSEGYLELVWQMVSTPAAAGYTITAGVNDALTFYSTGPYWTTAALATNSITVDVGGGPVAVVIPDLLNNDIDDLEADIQAAITAATAPGEGAKFLFDAVFPVGPARVTLTDPGYSITLNTNFARMLGFAPGTTLTSVVGGEFIEGATALPVTVAPGVYANIAALNVAFKAAIASIGHFPDHFILTENGSGAVVLSIEFEHSVFTDNTFMAYLGFPSVPVRLIDDAAVGPSLFTATANTQWAVMHDSVLSLFRKASLYINNVQVHSVDYPVFSNLVRNLQDYSQDYVSKHKEQWFYIEPSSHALNTPLAGEKQARTGLNLRVRSQIPLKRIFPFLDAYDKVLRGVEVRLELERNEYNVSEIVYAQRASAAITLHKLTMWIPEVKGSPSVEAMLIDDVVSPRELAITYDNYEVYRQLNPPQQELTWVIDSISEVPKYVFVGLQTRSQLDEINPTAATADINPSIYQNLNLVRAECTVNGHVFPKQRYDINFAAPTANTSDEYTRLYWEFIRVQMKENEVDNGSLLEYTQQFKDVYPLITFNMSRDNDVMSNKTQNNNVQIFLQFATAPAEDFYITAAVVYENSIVLSTDGKNYEWRRI